MYPENVALPIGGELNDKYLLIEIHYDNPGMERGDNFVCNCIVSQSMYHHR